MGSVDLIVAVGKVGGAFVRPDGVMIRIHDDVALNRVSVSAVAAGEHALGSVGDKRFARVF